MLLRRGNEDIVQDLVVHDFNFGSMGVSPRRFDLILILLFRHLFLPNLHIGVASLTGRYRLDVTADRSRDFRAQTASLVLDHLEVV